MRNLVRGGLMLAITSLFVALIYAQTRPEKVLSIANDPQVKTTENTVAEEVKPTENETDNKLVKNTVMVKAARAAGVSRGSFVATAYCLKGRTASGSFVRKGIIAADPRVLRLGTNVFLGAGSYSGEYKVTDTGGKIKGNRIDIWMASCAEAIRFGRRTVSISSITK